MNTIADIKQQVRRAEARLAIMQGWPGLLGERMVAALNGIERGELEVPAETKAFETKAWVLGKLRRTIDSRIRSGGDPAGPVTNHEEFQARLALRMQEAEVRYDRGEAHRRQLLPSSTPAPAVPSGPTPHHAGDTVHP